MSNLISKPLQHILFLNNITHSNYFKFKLKYKIIEAKYDVEIIS